MSSLYLDDLKLGPFANWYIVSNSGSTLTACANCVTGVFLQSQTVRQSQNLVRLQLN